MKTLHEGLGISREEYDALLQHAKTTLDAVGVGARERDDVLSWMASLEGDMVEGH
jgi:truncated hemoglobin YjbI